MKGETEIKAKLYGVVESYYNSLDVLAKKLQDDYAGIKSFEQSEEDRLGLCFLLDYTDDLREKIKALHENERMISAEKRLKIKIITKRKEHQKSIEGIIDKIISYKKKAYVVFSVLISPNAREIAENFVQSETENIEGNVNEYRQKLEI